MESGSISQADMEVSILQYRAAIYILTSGPSSQGLSKVGCDMYLASLDQNGEVVSLWANADAFWKDHYQRQRQVLPSLGKWATHTIQPPRRDVPVYQVFIRELPTTISHVIESSKQLKLDGTEINWSENMTLCPRFQYNSEDNRILTDWQSGDDMNSAVNAMRKVESNVNVVYLPFQLFIDKANVSRLNKRSMYPVVLYLLCFSRKVRRALAVNVGFVPIVHSKNLTGKELSKEVTKHARSTVIQQGLDSLLQPITSSLTLTVNFPDGEARKIRPFLLSVVADAPEVAVLSSFRYGVRTAFPCPRCFIARESLGFTQPDLDLHRAAVELSDIYSQVPFLPTQGRRDHYLKSLSLRLPKSILLSRFE